jgi:hypothetical protein
MFGGTLEPMMALLLLLLLQWLLVKPSLVLVVPVGVIASVLGFVFVLVPVLV